MACGVAAGSNTSNSARRMPVINAAATIAAPPIWEIGKAIGSTSPAVMPIASTIPREPAITVVSLWRIPLGAAVVPDE